MKRKESDTTTAQPADFPATVTVHWPTGPVDCCVVHARALTGLGQMLGGHVVSTPAAAGAQCSNCHNESKATP